MTALLAELEKAIERNDVRAVVDQLRGASETDRRAAKARVMELAEGSWDFKGLRAAAAVAALGTASGVRQVVDILRTVTIEDWLPQAVEVLEERKPKWLDDLPRALLVGESAIPRRWRLVRALVRAGLIAKPDLQEYTTRMPFGLVQDLLWSRGDNPNPAALEQRLLDDPGLLGDEVFRLFRVEGAVGDLHGADSSLSGRWRKGDTTHPEATWGATLARLARAGHIDFDRLLDESMAVFLRDMKPTYFGWCVDFHERLAPTLDEMAARVGQYERLLAADSSLGVGVGQVALEKLLRADRLDLESFVTASRPALSRPEKGIVTKQMRLLGLVARQRPELASEIAAALEPALTHERADVQEAARALLSRLRVARATPARDESPAEPIPAGRAAIILTQAKTVAAASPLAPQIKACIEAVEAAAPVPGLAIPAGPGRPLPAPISDPEEVAVAFTRLVEDAGDPVLIERALAGAVRTARIPVEQRRRVGGPLGKRAAEQMLAWPSGLTSGDVRAMVASVAYTWSTGDAAVANPRNLKGHILDFSWGHASVNRGLEPITPTGAMSVRCIEAVGLIARCAPVELLSEPTHDRGTIDPAALAERARKNYGGWKGLHPPRYDLEAAALRVRRADLGSHFGALPKQVRERYRELLAEMPDQFGTGIVGGRWKGPYGNNNFSIVLSQVRHTGRESQILRMLTNLEDPVATYVHLSAEAEYTQHYGPSIKTWPLISPWLPELTAAHLLRPLSRALQTGRHELGPAAVSCVMNPDTPLDQIGHLVLAMGCVGAEEDTRTAAADAFAAASKDGRLQPEMMAGAWLDLHRCEAFQAKRLESTLRRLVSDPASSVRIAQSLQAGLGPLIEAGAREMQALLRLAVSAGEACGVFADDPRIGAVAERKAGSELVAAARAMVAARSRSQATPGAGNLEILEGLLQRR